MSTKFPTHIWEQALAQQRERREQRRQELLRAMSEALTELSRQIAFEEVYFFGSLTQPDRFYQLEKHSRREQILQEGTRWTKPAGLC